MEIKREKRYADQEPLAILRKHLLEGVAVSDICDEHQVQPTVFCRWQWQFFEQEAVAFRRKEKTRKPKGCNSNSSQGLSRSVNLPFSVPTESGQIKTWWQRTHRAASRVRHREGG